MASPPATRPDGEEERAAADVLFIDSSSLLSENTHTICDVVDNRVYKHPGDISGYVTCRACLSPALRFALFAHGVLEFPSTVTRS
jgi:hypothetical protein